MSRGLPKGFKHSEKTKIKMRESHLGLKPFLGLKHSEETKRKIRETKKGKYSGDKSSGWKGGRRKDINGYIYIYLPSHPYANSKNYVFEHRLVMETHLGRVLLPTERIHHINGIVNDNRIENLMLFSGSGEHTKFHYKTLKEKAV